MLLPDANRMMATAKAMAGMANPHPQLTFSCTYTMASDAIRLPTLMLQAEVHKRVLQG